MTSMRLQHLDNTWTTMHTTYCHPLPSPIPCPFQLTFAACLGYPGSMLNGNVLGIGSAVVLADNVLPGRYIDAHPWSPTHRPVYFSAAINLKFNTRWARECVCVWLCDYYIMAKTMSTAAAPQVGRADQVEGRGGCELGGRLCWPAGCVS